MVTGNSAVSHSNSRPGISLVYIAKALGLNRIINFVIQFTPRPIQEKITALKVQRYLDTYGVDGMVVLPMEDLKQKQRESLQYLIDRLGAENLGDYLEFGVFSGTSISCMYQVLQEFNLPQVRLFGFDSFEGMPESSATEDEGTWEPGQFKFGIEYTKGILTARGIDWNRVLLTKGWFCNTLTPEFRQQHQIKKASILMVDCDIYSSTVDVLKFCEPLIQDEVVVFFDDWNSNHLADKNLGEKKAFDEFLAAHPEFTIQEFGNYTSHSACFIVKRRS